jgi:hypothetical protein
VLNTSSKILHSNIALLKKQLNEANQTIRQLRRELAVAKRDEYFREERSWAEQEK